MAQYSGYVELFIPLPQNIGEDNVITDVGIQDDGSLAHVPTKIITQNGQKYVRIKTCLKGTYTIITSEKSFKDMKGHWAEDIVNDLASRLILDNDGKENFLPSKKATRPEFAQIITNALGLMQKGAGKDIFSNISKEDGYYDAVTIAYEYGIISGYEDGSFRPDKEITREEINNLLLGYPDNSSISPWAKEYVAICTKLGIVTGRNDNTIAPKDSMSMAEMAVMVHRLLSTLDLI